MKKMILLVFMVFLISGCASSGGWYKPNATTDDFHRDRGECLNDARKYNRTNLMFDPVLFSSCMQSKGWYWQEEERRRKQSEGLTYEEWQKKYGEEKPLTSNQVTPSLGTTKILTWDFSVVKSGPGNDYPVIATVRKGDKLTIMEQSGEWVRVRLENGQEGWVRSEVFE